MRDAADVSLIFHPRSVAVIGASADPGKIGSRIVENIVSGGFEGSVYPINPKGGELHGIPFSRRLADVKGEVDVAVIAVPSPRVFDAVKECCEKGVKHALIISSGFSEVGNREEEAAIIAHARRHGMRVLGPNIFGVYSAGACMNATFGPSNIRKGGVAIISQSGALGLAMIGKTAQENIGLSAIVSVGNKADLNEVELLDYLIADAQTEVILLYIEGIRNGPKLVEALQRATRVKPVIAIKSGRSQRGAMAAASHTGSLAGADEVFDDVMRQCGVLRAESIGEAFDLCRVFAAGPIGKADPLLIITNGGGIGVLAADACEKYGLSLFDDPEVLERTFAPVTPDFGSTRNPIDITGGATPGDYEAALNAALQIPSIGGVLALYCETAVFDATALASILRDAFAKYHEVGKPVAFSALGGDATEQTIADLRRSGIPVFPDVYDAVLGLSALDRYTRRRGAPVAVHPATLNLDPVRAVCDASLREDRFFLLADEAAEVMRAAGIPLPPGGIATNIEEAVNLAEKLGYPVALKVVSKEVIHKSDAGGIALSLDNREEVIEAYEAVRRSVTLHQPEAVIRGMEVVKMAPSGLEMIAAARRDPIFGPTIMVGLGGIYVEILKDVTFGAVPVDHQHVLQMIRRLRTFPLLLGARGEERKDIEAVAAAVLKLAEIIVGCPAITDIEVNPIRVYEEGAGVLALDARILLDRPPSPENPPGARAASAVSAEAAIHP
jgi:acetate---CoA ligase (ADP-forming)